MTATAVASPPNPEIRPGQVWKRKGSESLFTIAGPFRTGGVEHDDWIWKGYDFKGRGVSHGEDIRRRNVLVAQSVKELENG